MLATLILIAITVAGAALVYQVFLRSAAIQSSNGELSVQSFSIEMSVSSGQGQGVISVTLENVGTKAVNSTAQWLTLTLKDSKGNTVNPASFAFGSAALSPGQTINGTGIGTFTFNSPYSYAILATFSDGSTYVTSGAVTALQ